VPVVNFSNRTIDNFLVDGNAEDKKEGKRYSKKPEVSIPITKAYFSNQVEYF